MAETERRDAAERGESENRERRRDDRGDRGDRGDRRRSTGARTEAPRRRALTGPQAALSAAEQLVDLTGKEFEGIVGIAKADDGWTVEVEVLEMRRIPSTTDVLASYEVTVDREGDLTGYQRKDRYTRGGAGEERR